MRQGEPPHLTLATHVASAVTSLPRLKWSLAVGRPGGRLCEYAAARGLRDLLDYMIFVDGLCMHMGPNL